MVYEPVVTEATPWSQQWLCLKEAASPLLLLIAAAHMWPVLFSPVVHSVISLSGTPSLLKQVIAWEELGTTSTVWLRFRGAAAELKHRHTGQCPPCLTVTLHIRTFWHRWRPAHVFSSPSDHVHPKSQEGRRDCVEAKQEGVHRRRVPHILS